MWPLVGSDSLSARQRARPSLAGGVVVKAGTEVVFFPYASNLVMTAAESCVALTIMVSRQ